MTLALHFLSGKNKGKEFPLPIDHYLLLGRSEDNDVVVNDEKAPHKHATISTMGDQIVLKDLNSGGETFVNGQQAQVARLKEGDRVRIGSATFMLVTLNRFSAAFRSSTSKTKLVYKSQIQGKNLVEPQKAMSGSIKEMPVIDLLQFFTHGGKSGVLTIISDQETGKVFMRNGQIYYATINDKSVVHPLRTLYRLLRWKSGTFSFGPPDDRKVPVEIEDSTDSVLLEASQMIDELSGLESELPPTGARLEIAKPLPGPLRDLSPAELDVFQLVLEHGALKDVVDNYSDDLEAYGRIAALLRRKYIRAS